MGPVKRKLVIGLTGGIGSGKSLVALQLASLGCALIDADALGQAALDAGPVRRQLVRWWGQQVIGPDDRVDRRAVARIAFGLPDELARLEGLIHPIVYELRLRLRLRYEADPAVLAIVEDCPLLLEKELQRTCDVVIFVQAEYHKRLARLIATRGWTEQELARREKSQLPLDIKAERADHVIDNNAGEVDCLSHVRRVFAQIMQELHA